MPITEVLSPDSCQWWHLMTMKVQQIRANFIYLWYFSIKTAMRARVSCGCIVECRKPNANAGVLVGVCALDQIKCIYTNVINLLKTDGISNFDSVSLSLHTAPWARSSKFRYLWVYPVVWFSLSSEYNYCCYSLAVWVDSVYAGEPCHASCLFKWCHSALLFEFIHLFLAQVKTS